MIRTLLVAVTLLAATGCAHRCSCQHDLMAPPSNWPNFTLPERQGPPPKREIIPAPSPEEFTP